MSQPVNSQKRYRAIEFIAVVRQEVDANVPVKITERCWGMKGLKFKDSDIDR